MLGGAACCWPLVTSLCCCVTFEQQPVASFCHALRDVTSGTYHMRRRTTNFDLQQVTAALRKALQWQ